MSISTKLYKELMKVDRPGSFVSSGSRQCVIPGLEIEGIGPVGFPIGAQQAEEIKLRCEQAPYGKGDKTLLNTDVRRVWQLMPDKFCLMNPVWDNFLDDLLKTVEDDLGLVDQKLEAQLYNLLLYEKGSFFLPHRDGEKVKRMIATLVVVLPSSFKGGELIVRHDGNEQVIDFSSRENNLFETHFAAFYTDCEHEIRPLLEGYRLCLVYNLTLQKSKKQQVISAPRTTKQMDSISRTLQKWSSGSLNQGPKRLAIKLDHQYSMDGLTWETLKGVDRTRASVIREAARESGCVAHLAQLTLYEQGSAYDYEEYDGYGRYGRRRGKSYDESHHEPGTYEMEEIFESALTVNHLIDSDGNSLKIGSLVIEENEIVPEGSLRDVVPEEEYEGYLGNYGMTLERWYRNAVVLLWPEKNNFEFICDAGTAGATVFLAALLAKSRTANSLDASSLKNQCRELGARIIERWEPKSISLSLEEDDDDSSDGPLHFDDDDEADDDYEGEEDRDTAFSGNSLSDGSPVSKRFLAILDELDDSELVKKFIGTVLPSDSTVELDSTVARFAKDQGWSYFGSALMEAFHQTSGLTILRNALLLENLCSLKPSEDIERLQLCRSLCHILLDALKRVDKAKSDWRSTGFKRKPVLIAMIKSMVGAEEYESLADLVRYVLATPKKYSRDPCLVQTVLDLAQWLPAHTSRPCAVSDLIDRCVSQLEYSTNSKPEKPTDFRREAPGSCKCHDCKELITFLKDPEESIYRFRVRKSRRQHLHQAIDRHGIDLEHVTERFGSPYTLVCTKNTNSYKRKLKKYLKDKKDLDSLRSLQSALFAKWKCGTPIR